MTEEGISWAPGYETMEKRCREDVRGIVVHRIEVSQEDPSYGDTPAEVCRFFREHPVGKKATGGGAPYPILIDKTGGWSQVLPLGRISPHAVSHNPSTVGVACIGDFRSRPPDAQQRASLVRVCAALLRQLGLESSAVHGHDELSGGTRDPEKICPGHHLPMEALRSDIAEVLDGDPDEDTIVPELIW